jgi:hypothetical protein
VTTCLYAAVARFSVVAFAIPLRPVDFRKLEPGSDNVPTRAEVHRNSISPTGVSISFDLPIHISKTQVKEISLDPMGFSRCYKWAALDSNQ